MVDVVKPLVAFVIGCQKQKYTTLHKCVSVYITRFHKPASPVLSEVIVKSTFDWRNIDQGSVYDHDSMLVSERRPPNLYLSAAVRAVGLHVPCLPYT